MLTPRQIVRNLFWFALEIHFLSFVKADYFKEAVLKVESENVSAVEVAYYLDELRANMMIRKTEKYLGPDIVEEKNKLITSGDYDEEKFREIMDGFFGNFYSNSYEFFNFWSDLIPRT